MKKNKEVVKDTALLIVETVNEIEEYLKDGTLQLGEGFKLGDNALRAIKLGANYQHFPKDWERMKSDPQYVEEVIKSIEGLSVGTEKSKKITSQFLHVAFHVGKLVDIILEQE